MPVSGGDNAARLEPPRQTGKLGSHDAWVAQGASVRGREGSGLNQGRQIITARRCGSILRPDMLPGDDGANINGPSLVKVPDWVSGRLGAYYLYFAHHLGTYIRLAYADSLQGQWRIHCGGTLTLDQCPMLNGHIASPDVHVDHEKRRFVMYFHGPTGEGDSQATFAATSGDGLNFVPRPDAIGPHYARFFRHDGWWYGLLGTDANSVVRSRDGLGAFEHGPVVLAATPRCSPPRHVAVQKSDGLLRVYYTRKGDAPERIVHGTIDLARDWRQWTVDGAAELLRPATDFEGADLPVRPSRTGPAKGRENALRDPAIFEEDGRTWLLYAVAGESGISLAEIRSEAAKPGFGKSKGILRAFADRVATRLRSPSRTKPAARIFIAGCARSGTTLTRSLMGRFDDTYVHRSEAHYRLFDGLNQPQTNLVVKRTAGGHLDLSDLPASVGLIYCVRHPFDVLTSSHPETKAQRPFHVTTERWEAEYDGLLRLRQAQPGRSILILRYEDLIAEPDAAQQRIAQAFGLSATGPFSRDPNNPIRTGSLRKWESNEAFRTYLRQLPPPFLKRVEGFCREFGYDLPEWSSGAP